MATSRGHVDSIVVIYPKRVGSTAKTVKDVPSTWDRERDDIAVSNYSVVQ